MPVIPAVPWLVHRAVPATAGHLGLAWLRWGKAVPGVLGWPV